MSKRYSIWSEELSRTCSRQVLLSFLSCLLVLSVFFVACKGEQKKPKRYLIRDSDIVQMELFVRSLEIYSYDGKFAPGEIFDGYVDMVCPEFPSDVSLRLYLVDVIPEKIGDVQERYKYAVNIYPSTITCVGEFSSGITVYMQEDIKPAKYLAVVHFVLTATLPVQTVSETYIIKSVDVIQKWPGYKFLARDIRQVASIKLTDVVDAVISEAATDVLRMFAISSDKRLYRVELSPNEQKFSVNVFALKVQEPREIKVFNQEGEDIIVINENDKKRTEIIKLKGSTVVFSQLITKYVNPAVLLEKHGMLYLLSHSCTDSISVYPGGISELPLALCDLVDRKGGSVFIFRPDEISVISSTRPTTSFVIPQPDYILETKEGYLLYVRSGLFIDVYTLDSEGIRRTASLNIVRAPPFSEYIPIHAKAILLLYRYSDLSTVYVWDESQSVRYHQEIPSPESYFIKFAQEYDKVLISFQRSINWNFLIFDSGKLVDHFSLNFSGGVEDFVADEKRITVFLRLPNRIGTYLYNFEKKTGFFSFTQNIAERYKIVPISSESYVIFYTDSAGCWEDEICSGKEMILVSSRGMSKDMIFFVHTYPIHQKLVGISKIGDRLFFVLQDVDYIRIFSL